MDYLEYFRWFLNFIWVGVPWTAIGGAMIVINIVFNITLNDWWAGGNYLLIYNTYYIISQTLMSLPLVFEIPFYIKHARILRFWSSL